MNGIEIQSMIIKGVPTGSVQTTHMTSMGYSLSNIKYLGLGVWANPVESISSA